MTTISARFRIRGVNTGSGAPTDHLNREIAVNESVNSFFYGFGTGLGDLAASSHLLFRSDGTRIWHDIVGAADESTVFVGDGAALTGVVRLAGDQSVDGVKTFTSRVTSDGIRIGGVAGVGGYVLADLTRRVVSAGADDRLTLYMDLAQAISGFELRGHTGGSGFANLFTVSETGTATAAQFVGGGAGLTGITPAQVGAVAEGDSRLTDAREWTASTVTQAEAEAGTATTRRAWTAQRVRQAVAAWWAGSTDKTKLDGIAAGATANATDAHLLSRANHTGQQPASTISDAGALGILLLQAATAATARGDLGLGSAALENFSSGNNSDGYWVRIGPWQACWHYLDLGSITANGAGTMANPYHTAAVDWNFPQPFVDGNFAFVATARTSGATTGLRGALYATGRGRFTNRVSNVQAYRTSDNSTADTIFAMCIAVGRWA
jgi:hypothetical protein